MDIKQGEDRGQDAVKEQGKQSELLFAGGLRPPKQNQPPTRMVDGTISARSAVGGLAGGPSENPLGKNTTSNGTDHDMPATQGIREANAISLNDKDQGATESEGLPPPKRRGNCPGSVISSAYPEL
jgi:hypothetical protein